MIASLVAIAVGVIAIFAGVGCALVGTTQKKKNYVVFGIALPVVTWIFIVALHLGGSFSGEWP